MVGVDNLLTETGKDPGGDDALSRALGQSTSSVSDLQIFRDPQQDTVSLSLPIESYCNVLKAMGITTIIQDKDAVTRRIQAYDTFGDQVYYNWAFQIASQYLKVSPPSNVNQNGLTFNGRQVPLHSG